MKNLTVKKIALGLILAGYGASSAFASMTATTKATIIGNAPVMHAVDSTAQHTMTLRIYQKGNANALVGEGNKVKVGDIVKITFDLKDADGDVDKAKIKETFKVYTKKDKNSDWVDQTSTLVADTFKSETSGERGTITFVIPKSFSGAEFIGYKLLERTEFGAPYANQWLQVTDIWDKDHNPHTTAPTDETDPLGTGPKDDEGAGTVDAGPGDIDKNNGEGPIIEEGITKVGIFKVDSSNGQVDPAVNYAKIADTTPSPKYGDKFVAAVWDDENNNDIVDTANNEVLKRTGYTYTWKLTGTYEGIAADPDTELTAVNNGAGENKDTLQLGAATEGTKHNTLYVSSKADAYKAGAQGYKLIVEAK